jgi:hypothetical protein
VQAREDERPRPVRNVSGAERLGAGLSWVLVRRLFPLDPEPDARVLARTTAGRPFLVRGRLGQGSVYTFAVSARDDFSNLPKRFAFIVLVRRMLTSHLVQVGQPLSYPALRPLRLQLPPGVSEIIAPDGARHKLPPAEDLRRPRSFDQTARAGIYRVDAPPEVRETAEDEESPPTVPVAAVNVPTNESSLDKLDEESLDNIERIIGQDIFVTAEDESAAPAQASGSARATFPLAVLAMLMVAAASAMAWYMGRPVPRPEAETTSET